MKQFTKRYQLWLPTEVDGSYVPVECDTLAEALAANRVDGEAGWYITELISAEALDGLIRRELEGHPVVRRDVLDRLDNTYQLWNGDLARGYRPSTHRRLIDALKAPRISEDWYITQVVLTEGL